MHVECWLLMYFVAFLAWQWIKDQGINDIHLTSRFCVFGASFGSTEEVKNKEYMICALSIGFVYLVALLAWLWK